MFQKNFNDKNNIPRRILVLSYFTIPVLAFTYKYYLGNHYTKYIYDFLFLLLILLSICALFMRSKIINLKSGAILIIGSYAAMHMLLILFFNFTTQSSQTFYLMPFLMEAKLPLYLIFIGLFSIFVKKLSHDDFVLVSYFLSYLIIADFAFRFLFFDGLPRPSVISESNYDGMLVLLGLCSLFTKKNAPYFQRHYIVFGIATIATMSKTGIAVFLALSFIKFFNKRYAKYFLALIPLLALSIFVVSSRLSQIDDFSRLDRFLMWYSYFDLVKNSSPLEVLFGFPAGHSLKDNDNYINWFIQYQGSKVNADGLHAFIFHSFWLRISTTYGLLFSILIFSYLLRLILKPAPYNYFAVLILLQGFSMGVFYNTVNVIPLVFYWAMLFNSNEHKVKS